MSIVYADTITQVDGPTVIKFAMEVKDHYGRIECNCKMYKGRKWCDHVQKVVTENLDRDTFLYKPSNDNPVLVMVPVVPSESFWVMVVLSDLHKTDMYLASVNLADDPSGSPRSVELGVVLVGHEGRSALRRMVIAWLGEAGRGMWCSASTHNQTRMSKRQPAKDHRDLKHVFSLLNNGCCQDCAAFQTFDDDVPDL